MVFTDYSSTRHVDEELRKRISYRLQRPGYAPSDFGPHGSAGDSSGALFLHTVLRDLHAEYLDMLATETGTATSLHK